MAFHEVSIFVKLLFGISALDNVSGVYPVHKNHTGKFSIGNEVFLLGNHIVVSQELRARTLGQIHHGIVQCRLKAQLSIWWPKMSQDIQEIIKQCLRTHQ